MKMLLVEDDQRLADLLQTALKQQNHLVDWVSDGCLVKDYVEAGHYDLLILDVVLPSSDGIEVCRELRASGYSVPILLLTARDEKSDKVQGLDAGADDYVVKPFDLEELQARIRALLRRKGEVTNLVLEWGALRLDPSSCEVTYAEELIRLTPKEYGLLELLMHSPGRVFSISSLLEQLWSFEDAPGDRAVRMHIKGLRQKLKQAGAPEDLVETVYGIGYRLGSTPSQNGDSTSNRSTAEVNNDPSANCPISHDLDSGEVTRLLLQRAWQQHKEVTLDQVKQITQRLRPWLEEKLASFHQKQIEADVHQLKGLLGSYGFTHASEFLQELLHRLQEPDQWERVHFLKVHRHLEWLIIQLQRDQDLPKDETPTLIQSPGQVWRTMGIIDPDPGRYQQLGQSLQSEGIQIYSCFPWHIDLDCIEMIEPQLLLLTLNGGNSLAGRQFSGLQICHQIHNRFPNIPILLIISMPTRALIEKGLANGAADFVTEPVQMEELIVRILRCLHSR
jgi:DNA-binding response OmpR family regulator/HPt (histidine-containing phosphotransfer) domain-containing protein